MRSEQSHYEELKAMQSECDRLRAERDNLATAIERVRKECDRIASTFIESDSQFASGAHKAASDIRDSIGSVGVESCDCNSYEGCQKPRGSQKPGSVCIKGSQPMPLGNADSKSVGTTQGTGPTNYHPTTSQPVGEAGDELPGMRANREARERTHGIEQQGGESQPGEWRLAWWEGNHDVADDPSGYILVLDGATREQAESAAKAIRAMDAMMAHNIWPSLVPGSRRQWRVTHADKGGWRSSEHVGGFQGAIDAILALAAKLEAAANEPKEGE